MGDNVCVSNQQAFRDWPARIPNVGVEVVVSMRKCVLPSREASGLVAEIASFQIPAPCLARVWVVRAKPVRSK